MVADTQGVEEPPLGHFCLFKDDFSQNQWKRELEIKES